MTRKEIATLKEMEQKAWLELQVYDWSNAPITTDYGIILNWEKTDLRHSELSHTWCALNDLMEAFRIEREFNEKAYWYINDLYNKRHGTKEENIENA